MQPRDDDFQPQDLRGPQTGPPPLHPEDFDVDPCDVELPDQTAAVNYRFLTGIVVVAVVLAVGIPVVHEFQVRRTAAALLKRAQQCRAEADPTAAAKYLRQYLGIEPDDDDVRSELGLLLADSAETPRQRLAAFLILDHVLRSSPQRSDIKRRLVDLSLAMRRYGQAASYLETLVQEFPDDAELHSQRGQCLEETRKYEEAAKAYQQAIKVSPLRFQDYEHLAELFRTELHRPAGADQLMNQLVEQNKRSHAAFLVRCRYHWRQRNVDLAVSDALAAYRLQPSAPEVLVTVSEIISTLGDAAIMQAGFDIQQVQKQLEQLARRDPGNVDVVAALADLSVRPGRTDLALELIRSGLKLHPTDIDLLWKKIVLLISVGQLSEARDDLQQFRMLKPPDAYVEVLQGLISIYEGDWLKASRTLEAVRGLPTDGIEVALLVELRLGQCYRKLRHVHREESAFRRARRLNRFGVEAQHGLASVLARTGRFDDALTIYRQMQRQPDVPIKIARLLIAKNLRVKPADRNWDEVNQVLNQISQTDENLIDVQLIRSDMLVIREQTEQARILLERALMRHPGEARLWVARANLHIRAGDPAAAQKVLAAAEETLGHRSELFLARLQFSAITRDEGTVEVVRKLESTIQQYKESDQDALFSGLAVAYAQIGDVHDSERVLLQLAERRNYDVLIHMQLVKLALNRNDIDRAKELIGDIHEIEGADGIYWRLAQASLDVVLSRAGAGNLLVEARELVVEVRELVPDSSQVAVILAQIDQLSGDDERAIENYLQAIDLGARSAGTVYVLVSLLTRQQRYSDAEDVLRKFEERYEVPTTKAFDELATEVWIQNKNYKQALGLAERAVADDPENVGKWLWLSRMQLAEGNTAEAETALQNAIKLDPTDPDVRVAFVSFLVGQDRTPEAEAAVQQARKQVAAKWRPLMLAKCYELVGKLELAEREYQTVLGADPRRSDVSWRLVRFYLRGGRLDDARALLETLIDPQNKTPIRILLQARRALSTLLVLNGPYSAYKRATTLIEANLKTEPGNTQDLLAQAKLLQTRPNRRLRRQAILILEDLNERSVLSDRDKFDLARLYVAVGKWPQARLWLMSLISTKSKNAQWLACGVRNSIAHGELTGICEIWLEQLERLQPESLRTLELRAQYLVAHRRIDDGLKLIDQWLHRADGDEPPPGRLRTVAMLLSSFADTLDRTGQTAESARLSAVAEQHFRRLVEREPNAIPAMIRFFQRRDRIDEALSWCERAWQHASPEEVAAACVALLSTGRMSEEQVGSLLLSIEKSRREHPDLRRLLIHHANAALLARRYSQAEDLYREVIREFPNAYLAYNDLALLVIFRRGNSAEALPLVEKAIEIVGPLPFLLDSRATVYLSMQDADSAAQDLQQAIEDDPTPEKYFHLTQAQLALKNAPAAKSAYEKAVEANLHVGALHPLEAPAYAEVSAAIMRIKSSVKNQR